MILPAGLMLGCLPSARAANDLYWDTNGTAAGSGAATGTWGTDTFWSTDADGIADAFQSATAGNNDLHFAAGTNGTTETVTISGTQLAGGLYFEESALTLSGGTITLSDGAVINNTTGAIPRISSALSTSGTVSLSGTRIWLDNPSFAGGGTLNVSTSNNTLLVDGGALNGLSVINLLTGGLDIRTSKNGYNYAAGTTLNFVNSLSLYTLGVTSASWLGDITVANTKTASLNASTAGNTFTIAGNISGAGAVSAGGSGTMVFSGMNTYTGTTTVSAAALRITGGAAIADTGLVNLSTSGTANTFDVQNSETIGGLGGGTAAFSVVNIATGQTLILSAGTQTYSGTFSGTGGLTVAGAAQTLASSVTLADLRVENGSLTLAAANTITGGLIMSGGTIQLRDAAAAGVGVIQASGGTLQVAVARGGTLSLPNAITVSAGSRVSLSPQTNGGSSGTATVNFAGTMTINTGGILQLGSPGSNAAYGTDNGAVAFGANAVGGTKFQLNGHSFTTTGLSTDAFTPGAPAVENGSTSNATLTVALPASGTGVYAGTLRNGGAGSLALAVNGGAGAVLTLAGANTHTGATTVTGGSLVLAHHLALQNSTVTSGGTGLVFDSSVSGHAFTFGGLSGAADLALEDNASNAVTLTIGNNGSSQTYSGVLSGSGALTKVGAGTQTLNAAQTYTGATTVNGGTLRILFAAGPPTSNIIDPGSALVLGGGTFLQQQTTSGPNAQTLNGMTVRAGSSVVNQTRVGGGTMLLTLGAVTRETGGTVAFSANGGGTSGIAATGVNTASGIIGGYATYFTTNGGANYTNGIDWATFSGSKIVALASGSYSNTSATTAATNLNMTSSLTLGANVTVGSVRFNDAITTPTLTLNGTHTIDSGGILVTGNVGANATLITGGTLTSGNGQDLIVIQNNTNASGALTLDVTITGAIGFTKSGGGRLNLTGTNEYTGDTYLNGGVTSISSNASLGAVSTGAAVHLNGGTLAVESSLSLDNAGSNQRDIVLGDNGGTLDVACGQTLTVSGALSGEGTLNKTGSGSLVLSGNSTQTGITNVTAGNLQVGVASSGQTGTVQVILNGTDAVLSGTGQVQGTTTVTQGTIRPGDDGGLAVGTLTTSELIFTPATTTTVIELQITGSSGASTLAADKITIDGALTLNGNSQISVNGDTYIPTLGDTFVLIDWSTVLDTGTTSIFYIGTRDRTGANIGNEGNLDLPDLSSYSLAWDIIDFSGSGSLTLVVVPEPARVMLFLMGGFSLCLRRRRR